MAYLAKRYRIDNGPAYERYLNTPMQVAADELRTELYLSIVEQPK